MEMCRCVSTTQCVWVFAQDATLVPSNHILWQEFVQHLQRGNSVNLLQINSEERRKVFISHTCKMSSRLHLTSTSNTFMIVVALVCSGQRVRTSTRPCHSMQPSLPGCLSASAIGPVGAVQGTNGVSHLPDQDANKRRVPPHRV